MKQMINAGEQSALPSTTGIIIHRSFLYYLFLLVVSLGRERAYRQKALDLASLKTGDSVLDIGCATGTLSIAARQRVGPSCRVYGLDASPEMLATSGEKTSHA